MSSRFWYLLLDIGNENSNLNLTKAEPFNGIKEEGRMEKFMKIFGERIKFLFTLKKDWESSSMWEGFQKINSEESMIGFLRINFIEITNNNILLKEDLDFLGEEILFSKGIIYPGNAHRVKKEDGLLWIENKSELILFNLSKKTLGEDYGNELVIINSFIKCMIKVSMEVIVYDTHIETMINSGGEFFLSSITSVRDSNISLYSGRGTFLFCPRKIKKMPISRKCKSAIEIIKGTSSVKAEERTEIHLVTDFATVTTSGHVDIVEGRAWVTLEGEGDVLTIAEKAVVLTKSPQVLSPSPNGDGIFIRFQEGPEPKCPDQPYQGWYCKERDVTLAKLGNCRVLK